MKKLDYSKLDPSMLNKPMSELGIALGGNEEGGTEGIQVTIPEGMEGHEKKEEVTVASEESDDKSKVPYTRFKKFHDRALEAEEEADYWKRQAQRQNEDRNTYEPAIPNVQINANYESADFDRFKRLFAGQDNAEIREAYKLELERAASIEERATQRAMEAIERRSSQEREGYRENLSVLDQNLEEAAEILGRDLSSEEEIALLEIQDDYSPKDREGNITALIPVEKAVEIYEMQQRNSPRRQARNAVAALSGGSSEGEGSASEQQNKDYNPRGGWRQVFRK